MRGENFMLQLKLKTLLAAVIATLAVLHVSILDAELEANHD
jgi:hypothetical protein